MQKSDIRISLENFNNICRVCLSENHELQSIYGFTVAAEEKSTPVSLVEIFKTYCSLEVSPTDEKPQFICKLCLRLVCVSYSFFAKCSQSDEILDTILIESKDLVLNDVPQENVESKDDKIKTRARSSKQESLYPSDSEDEPFIADEDSDWEPTELEVKSASVKSEDEFLETEADEKRKTPIEEKEKEQELKANSLPKKRGRPRKNAIRETKNNADDSEAIENQHKELICRLCNEVLPDINTSIDHYDEVHAPDMENDACIFCDIPKVYKRRDNFLYHMGLHSKFSIKCIPCRKYFRDKLTYTEHLKECFKVDIQNIKLEEEMTKPEVATNQPFQAQISQKVLKETQYDGVFKCQICKENLGQIDRVISHYEDCHAEELSCIICLRMFTKQVPLFHLGLHSTKSNICRPCRIYFRTKEEYDEHYAKYDHDNSLSCKICGKQFTSNYKKNEHMLSHLKEKNYSCNKCGKTFTYKTSLVRHFKMHFGKRFLCSSCGNSYTTKFMLQRHIRVMHTYVDEEGKPLPKPAPKPVKLQCEFCGEIFTTKYGYGRHIRRHPEFREFKCKICSFMCDTREQLDVHMEGKHNKHTCDVCGKRFPFESELKTHHRKHEDMQMARFRCDLCGKTARTQTQLKVHHRIHTGERPFSCEICGKSFKQTAHLKVHMFQHTGKMPFKCEICEKTFPFQHVMEIHLRTHTGDKPYQCMYCGNAYHDQTTMKKHQKKKHPEMPLQKTSRHEFKTSTFKEMS